MIASLSKYKAMRVFIQGFDIGIKSYISIKVGLGYSRGRKVLKIQEKGQYSVMEKSIFSWPSARCNRWFFQGEYIRLTHTCTIIFMWSYTLTPQPPRAPLYMSFTNQLVKWITFDSVNLPVQLLPTFNCPDRQGNFTQ